MTMYEVLTLVVQSLGLVAIIVYVKKTHDVAMANTRSAEAAERAVTGDARDSEAGGGTIRCGILPLDRHADTRLGNRRPQRRQDTGEKHRHSVRPSLRE